MTLPVVYGPDVRDEVDERTVGTRISGNSWAMSTWPLFKLLFYEFRRTRFRTRCCIAKSARDSFVVFRTSFTTM